MYIFEIFFNIFVVSILANPLPAVEPSENSIRSENIGLGWTSSWGVSSDTSPDSGQFVALQDQNSAEGNDVNWNNAFSQPFSTSYDDQPTNAGSRQQLYAEGEPPPLQEEQGNPDCDGRSGKRNGAGKLHSREDGGSGICKAQPGDAASVQVVPTPVVGDFSTTIDRLKKKSCAGLLLYAVHACCAGLAAGKINNIYPFIDNCAQRKFSYSRPSPRCGKSGKVRCGSLICVFLLCLQKLV